MTGGDDVVAGDDVYDLPDLLHHSHRNQSPTSSESIKVNIITNLESYTEFFF